MTQNEKDREFLNFVDNTYFDGIAFSKGGIPSLTNEESTMFQVLILANRLLTERENADVGYLHDPAKLLNYRDQHATCFFNKQESWNGVRGIKGVWIPVEEAE
ncbi:hypothetical protein [Listeria booriae]|uniref:hypothetical protein n=1 Tax=Listeria booriae TaxID=1552123 RepID=UPI0016287FBC|nr:hypothetical protein [Listeria booriae]MBC1233659.1 hypothetical protein [Listeria booriae]